MCAHAGHKAFYAKDHAVMKNLAEIVQEVQPSILIGKYVPGRKEEVYQF